MEIGTIGIIGGTGSQGSGLAIRWSIQGYNIRIGSRSEEKGNAAAKKFTEIAKKNNVSAGSIEGGDNEFATKSDIVVLAIPADQVDHLLTPLNHHLDGKVILDVTVNLKFGKFPKAELFEGKSSYEYVRDLFPMSKVVACFKTISAEMLNSMEEMNQTDFQISLDEAALELASKLALTIGLTPLRIKGKVHAHTIERMVALAIQINKGYPGSHAGYLMQNVNIE
ncbi:MAG: F420-dependent NADP reductase [Candidatus Heimdallarchaeota archaeon LC_2]|nr:MAG: F420-dependent NADP reductase [Candidatus Heimdallarchaeota archaeon LC_2]